MKKSILIIIFILNIFLINKVFADFNYIQIYPTISTSGIVTYNGVMPSGSIAKYIDYAGEFNTPTSTIAQWTGCPGFPYGGNWTSSLTTNYSVEGGFLNGAGNTPDGNYFTLLYSNCTEGDVFWFSSNKQNGNWSGEVDYTGNSGLEFTSPTIGLTKLSPINFSGNFDRTIALPTANNIYIFISPRNGSTPVPFTLIPITGDTGSFSEDVELPNGDYDWTARLYDSTTYTFGNWYPSETSLANYFRVGIPTPSGDLPLEACTSILDIGCGIRNAITWVWEGLVPNIISDLTNTFFDNIPENLINLNFFPFNIIGDLQASMIEGLTYIPNDTSANYTVSVPLLGSTLTILDLGTIQNFMGTTATNNIKGLLAIILWISFFFMIYYTIFDEAIYLSMPIKNRM